MSRVIADIRVRFLIALVCWSLVLLAIVRSSLGTRLLVQPLVRWQSAFAGGVGGSPVSVDLSCSGSDAIALAIAAIAAYPTGWRRRVAGVALVATGLAGLNLLRVLTLVNTAGSPLFIPLHTYIWPALMIGGAAAFLAGWIWMDQRTAGEQDDDFVRKRNVAIAAALLLIAYVAATPWLLGSQVLQRGAMFLATAAAGALRALGTTALVGGSTLVVGQQSFLVTSECIVTPLMPVYFAWALVWPRRAALRVAALVMAVPLFATLGLLRLLTVALPAIIGPPLFLTHGFYQFAGALLLLVGTARWRVRRTGAGSTLRVAAYGILVSLVVALAIGPLYRRTVTAASQLFDRDNPKPFSTSASAPDVQGAISIMPVFQLALLCGLCVALFGRRAGAALTVLVPAGAVLQVVTLVVAREVGGGLAHEVPITAVRAISLAIPLALTAAAARYARAHAQAGSRVPSSL